MKKLLFVILDGAGDVRIRGKTALEFANTKNMDFIASSGKTGLLYPIKNVAPESDESMLTLLGYDPYRFYSGRGPIEAEGIGLKFNGVALRGNFSVIKNGVLTLPSARISDNVCKKLCKLLNRKINISGVKFVPTKGYRFVLILSKKGLSDQIQDTHPGYLVLKKHVSMATKDRFGSTPRKCRPLANNKSAARTAALVNEITLRAGQILKGKNSANFILLRGAGTRFPKLRKLKGKWAMFADSPADKGFGRAAGMKILKKPGTERQLAKDVVAGFAKFDRILVQIKSPDKCSHNRDFQGKIRALEKIDKDFFETINTKVGLGNLIIVITADHSTSSVLGTHTKDPVPVAISSPWPDDVEGFGERCCSKGSLGKITGHDLMRLVEKSVRDFKKRKDQHANG